MSEVKQIYAMTAREIWTKLICPWWHEAEKDPKSILFQTEQGEPTINEVDTVLTDTLVLKVTGQKRGQLLFQIAEGEQEYMAAFITGLVIGRRFKMAVTNDSTNQGA